MTLISSYEGDLPALQPEYQTRGKKEGGKLRPPSDASDLDVNESELLGKANKRVADENNLFDTAVIEAGRVATSCRDTLAAVTEGAREFLADDFLEGRIEARLSAERHKQEQIVERRLRLEAEYNWFRSKNDIVEEADYPESRIYHFGLVAVILLLEAGANAFFYRNQGGLLGGFFVAFAISALSLGFAIAFGWAFRYRNLSGSLFKVLGWSAFAAFVAVTIFFGALFASFRSEYQLLTDPSDPLQLAAGFGKAWAMALSIFGFRFHFLDIFSFLLFGVTLLLSCFAFYKGYSSDDKHPGYSAKARVLKVAIAAQAASEDSIRDAIGGLLSDARSKADSLIQEFSRLLATLSGKEASLQQARVEMLTRMDRLTRDFKMVLDAYRHSNVAIRTVPPPAYFQTTPPLDPPTSAVGFERAISLLKDVGDDARNCQTELQSALIAKRHGLQTLSTRILNERLRSYFIEVQDDVRKNIARVTTTIHRNSGDLT